MLFYGSNGLDVEKNAPIDPEKLSWVQVVVFQVHQFVANKVPVTTFNIDQIGQTTIGQKEGNVLWCKKAVLRILPKIVIFSYWILFPDQPLVDVPLGLVV